MIAIEDAVGEVDGTNSIFETPTPYVAGSLRVYVNGRLVASELDDGFLETNPGAGSFTMNEPPQVGSTLVCYYAQG